ncbi:MAG: hypothetical protein FWG70_05370 [Oscillospiraceae bacterium]|nr:hypothetical protein [Oscillospiraceae bacterium]
MDNELTKNHFKPFEQMTFDYTMCFLCGELLNDEIRTDEHVYPRWLQNKFDLRDKKLTLLNGSLIPYRKLTIPCCVRCNKIMGETLEKPIERAVSIGYDSFIKLDEKIIFKWLNKLSYGILYKELSLKNKISEPQSDSIYSKESLKKHEIQFTFLQSIIHDVNYIEEPWSILIFKIESSFTPQYWAYDNPFYKTFFIKMNDIGIIAHLMDNGCQKGLFMEHEEMKEFLYRELHPIQYFELCAKIFYKSILFNKNPFYTVSWFEEKLNTIVSHSVSGEVFDKWSQEEYAHILKFFLYDYCGIEFQDIYKGDNLIMTYLRNEDGSFKDCIGILYNKNMK